MGAARVGTEPNRLPGDKENQRGGADPAEHGAVQSSPRGNITTQPLSNHPDHILPYHSLDPYASLKFYAVHADRYFTAFSKSKNSRAAILAVSIGKVCLGQMFLKWHGGFQEQDLGTAVRQPLHGSQADEVLSY